MQILSLTKFLFNCNCNLLSSIDVRSSIDFTLWSYTFYEKIVNRFVKIGTRDGRGLQHLSFFFLKNLIIRHLRATFSTKYNSTRFNYTRVACFCRRVRAKQIERGSLHAGCRVFCKLIEGLFVWPCFSGARAHGYRYFGVR